MVHLPPVWLSARVSAERTLACAPGAYGQRRCRSKPFARCRRLSLNDPNHTGARRSAEDARRRAGAFGLWTHVAVVYTDRRRSSPCALSNVRIRATRPPQGFPRSSGQPLRTMLPDPVQRPRSCHPVPRSRIWSCFRYVYSRSRRRPVLSAAIPSFARRSSAALAVGQVTFACLAAPGIDTTIRRRSTS